MWELITQKEPWGDVKLFDIPEMVCKGERPKIPENCPTQWARLIQFCWLQSPSDRPTFSQILSYLEKMEKDEIRRDRSVSKLGNKNLSKVNSIN